MKWSHLLASNEVSVGQVDQIKEDKSFAPLPDFNGEPIATLVILAEREKQNALKIFVPFKFIAVVSYRYRMIIL